MGLFDNKEKAAEGTEAPKVEEKAAEAPKAEEKAAEGPKPVREKKALDEKKIEQDDTNNAHFMVGDEFEIQGLPFVVKEVKGLELILTRTDIK